MKYFLLIINLLIIVSTANAADDIRVSAAIAEGDIYVGQPFQYQVIIEGYRQGAEIDLSPLQPWSPKKAGERDFSSERITIFNGRQRRIIEKKYVVAYNLIADQAGKIILPPLSVTIKGKAYATNPVSINSLELGKTDSIQLEMIASQTTCFVGQPVTVTINWYLDRDIGEYILNVPFLNMTESFTIEDILPVQKAGHKMVEIVINSQKIVASMHAATYQNHNYTAITFQKIIIAKHPGSHTLEAPRASCDLAIGTNNRNRNSIFQNRRKYRRFQAVGKPVSLEVQELPNEGKPEGFSGLVGQYSIDAQASPTQVNVGDPITLTVEIKGDLLKSVDMPDLKVIDEFEENFKIPKEQAAPKTNRNTKKFTQTIRADNDRIKEIPPIELNFFDVDQGRYVTIESDPIPLEVAPTHVVTADQAVGNEVTVVKQSEIEVVKHGIAANYEGPDIYRNQSFNALAAITQPFYLSLYLAPLLLVLLALIARLLSTQSPLRQKEKRRANALRNALSELKQLKGRKKTAAKEAALKIGDIFRTFIADSHDKKSESLTPGDCRTLLTSSNNSPEKIERFCKLLEQSDNSRYGGDPDTFQTPDYPEIANLLKKINHDALR